jgi:hypothetical protein
MRSQTKACTAKRLVRSVPFWNITNISGQFISPIFKQQEIQKRYQSMTSVTWHHLFYGTLFIIYRLKDAQNFGSWVCFRFHAKKPIT